MVQKIVILCLGAMDVCFLLGVLIGNIIGLIKDGK